MKRAAPPGGPGGCPLCSAPRPGPFHRDRFRGYLRCDRCDLVFVRPADLPDPAREKARYDLHRNDPSDPGYRRFAARLARALWERIPPGAEGLDFGSGPGGGALAALFRERGWTLRRYDPFYAPDESVWSRTWDFIAAAEVVEHLHRPGREWDRLFRALRPGGWLGVMTGERPGRPAFADWPYLGDETHVAFYSAETMAYIARRWRAERVEAEPGVTLFRSPREGRLAPS